MTNTKQTLSAILPVALFSAAAGALAGAVTTFYKFLAGHAVSLSGILYSAPKWLPILAAAMVLTALMLPKIYGKVPELKGGGIPTAIAAIRGLRPLPWLRNTVGPFFLSLLSFVLGVPLGTEGPSVQFSAAIGDGISRFLPQDHRKYLLTAGASAGFAVATGAPLSGLLFAVEEVHCSVSLLVLLSAGVGVFCANAASQLLSPLLGVSTALFALPELPVLTLRELWLPLLIGLIMGLFSIVFLKGNLILRKLHKKISKTVPQWAQFLAIFALTLLFGFLSPDFISTGHHLVQELMHSSPTLRLLLLVVVVRCVLTLSANATGVTGGTFLPQLAIGTAAAAAAGCLLLRLGVPESYFPLLLTLGLCGCVAGMMKMPITAIAFSVEALGLSENLIPMLLVAGLSYLLPKLCRLCSVSDYVLEHTPKTK